MECSSCRYGPNAPGRLEHVLPSLPYAERLHSNPGQLLYSLSELEGWHDVRDHSTDRGYCSPVAEQGDRRCHLLLSPSAQEGAPGHFCASSLRQSMLCTTDYRYQSLPFPPSL